MNGITSFRAGNFRSLRKVEIDKLPQVVLLYGANEAGKSNLIRAIESWLRLLSAIGADALYEGSVASNSDLRQRILSHVTHGESKVELGGQLQIDELRFEFHLSITAHEVRVLEAIWPDGRAELPPFSESLQVQKLQEFLARPWSEVSAERQFVTEYLSHQALESQEALDPQGRNLKRFLFRAANSSESKLRNRFYRDFCQRIQAGPFEAIPVPIVALKESEIELIVGNSPIEDRGSGYRQWAILCGLLTMGGAQIAGIEEPESHLSWESQRGVAQALRSLVDQGPPQQLFVATHSPECLEMSPDSLWFEVAMTADGTRIARRNARDELQALFPEIPAHRLEGEFQRLLQGGYVRLPERAVSHLQVQPLAHLYCTLEEAPVRAIRLVPEDEMERYLSP